MSPGIADASAEVTHFIEHGWVLTRSHPNPDQVARWVDEVAAWPDADGPWLHHRELTDDGPKLCRTENFVPFHDGLRALLTTGSMLATASALLGEPAVLYKEKINYKLPGGAGYAPHQDAPAYRFVRTHVSCMVAVDDASLDNGCLEVVSGRHHELLPIDDVGCIRPDVVAQMEWEPVEVRAGETLWFHSRTPHRSGPNLGRPSPAGALPHLQRRVRGRPARLPTTRRSWRSSRRRAMTQAGSRSRSSATSRGGLSDVRPSRIGRRGRWRCTSGGATSVYDEELSQLDHALQTAALARGGARRRSPGGRGAAPRRRPPARPGRRRPRADRTRSTCGTRPAGPPISPGCSRPPSPRRSPCTCGPSATSWPSTPTTATCSRRVPSPASLARGAASTRQRWPRSSPTPDGQAAVALRRWDDQGKVDGLDVPDLASYRSLLERLAATPR